MAQTLKERINEYQSASAIKLMRRIPLIITINGRSFRRVTSKLEKPFDNSFSNVMCATMTRLCHEIEGAVLGYTYNDEIVVIARNDQSFDTLAWYQNDIQKISSITSSIATLEFNNASFEMSLPLSGEPLFISSVYTVPNMTEALNVLISKQQSAVQSSLNFACMYELSKQFGDDAYQIVNNRTPEEKEEILSDYGKSYSKLPINFRRGIACYKAPIIIPSKEGELIRNKWVLNNSLPIFSKDIDFLENILKTGTDIIRV